MVAPRLLSADFPACREETKASLCVHHQTPGVPQQPPRDDGRTKVEVSVSDWCGVAARSPFL